MDIVVTFVEFTVVGFALIAGIFLVRNAAQGKSDHMRQTYELFFPAPWAMSKCCYSSAA